MKLLLAITTICLLYLHNTQAQPKTLNGVYAGIQIMPGVTMGGGMSRYDYVFLFRPDGTFNDEIEKPDWKTRITGRYTISGTKLNLTYSDNKKTKSYTVEADADIKAGSYNLLKQPESNNIPAGYYEFSKMSSSGGGSSGMVYVGTASNKGLNFDGKGNFSNSSSSATVVSGEGIGGGGGRDKSGAGTYKISNGVLTLTYNNGTTETHSFFCRPGYKPIMAVVDGNIYFMKDPKEIAAKAKASGRKERPNTSSTAAGSSSGSNSTATTPPTGNFTEAKSLLLKANSVHGGTALDNVKTVSMTAKLQGMDVSTIVDIAGERVRFEIRYNGKLMQVEQLNGKTGWIWRNGHSGSLPATRMAELQAVFSSGILGLRKQVVNSFEIISFKQADAGNAVGCKLNGRKYMFIMNDEGTMLASGDDSGQMVATSIYTDLRKTGGVLVPFHEVMTMGSRKTTVHYQTINFNMPFDESRWDRPE